jgi:methionine biosynthesis protein MetW
MITPKSKVLDLGCGNGELLKFLQKNRQIDGKGIEIDLEKVQDALNSGISVIHGDLEEEILNYPDKHFDYCILSQTLQDLKHPEQILLEMLRVSKYVIVSFINLAHISYRFQILFRGRFPKAKDLPFKWLSTNIFFLSIGDFRDLCQSHQIRIEKQIYLVSEKIIRFWPSLRAKIAVFELSN